MILKHKKNRKSQDTCEVGYTIKEAADGGFIIAGNSIVDGKAQALVIKTDSLGGESWSKTFGDTALFNWLRDIEVTADGSYIAAGYKGTDIMPNNDCDAWVVKLDGSGNITWENTYGGINLEMVYSIKQDGTDYVFSGETRSFGSGSDYEADIWVVKIDSNGNQIWSKTYGGGNNDTGKAIDIRSDGGYVVVGDTMTGLVNAYDIMVLKLDSNGNN